MYFSVRDIEFEHATVGEKQIEDIWKRYNEKGLLLRATHGST
jgi:hypothetical protein